MSVRVCSATTERTSCSVGWTNRGSIGMNTSPSTSAVAAAARTGASHGVGRRAGADARATAARTCAGAAWRGSSARRRAPRVSSDS